MRNKVKEVAPGAAFRAEMCGFQRAFACLIAVFSLCKLRSVGGDRRIAARRAGMARFWGHKAGGDRITRAQPRSPRAISAASVLAGPAAAPEPSPAVACMSPRLEHPLIPRLASPFRLHSPAAAVSGGRCGLARRRVMFTAYRRVERHQDAQRIVPHHPDMAVIMRRKPVGLVAVGCVVIRHRVPG
jgi:hypothetical protein